MARKSVYNGQRDFRLAKSAYNGREIGIQWPTRFQAGKIGIQWQMKSVYNGLPDFRPGKSAYNGQGNRYTMAYPISGSVYNGLPDFRPGESAYKGRGNRHTMANANPRPPHNGRENRYTMAGRLAWLTPCWPGTCSAPLAVTDGISKLTWDAYVPVYCRSVQRADALSRARARARPRAVLPTIEKSHPSRHIGSSE